MIDTLSGRLADFTLNLTYDGLPADVIAHVKALVLHNIGQGIAGYEMDTAQQAIAVARTQGRGKSTVLMDGGRLPATAAAFANGAIMQSRGQADYFEAASMHPGVMVVPAALAVAETVGAGGRELVAALAAGYEIAVRAGADIFRPAVARGFRSTPVFGILGAAAAAGKLLRLDERQLVFAFGWAANMASGLFQHAAAGTAEFPFQDGLAAENGVKAALLGQAGVAAAADMLEGEKGLYFALCGSREGLEKIVEGLDKEYRLMEVCMKTYPVGVPSQTQVRAALALVQESSVAPENIDRIEVGMSAVRGLYVRENNLKPGIMNMQYCVAVACVHRKVTLPLLLELNDSRVLALLPRITMVQDAGLARMGSTISITLKDGTVLRKNMPITSRDYILTFEQERKLVEGLLPEMALPADRLGRVIGLISSMEDWRAARPFMKALTCPVPQPSRIRLTL